MTHYQNYPFSAIVGQEAMCQALLLNAVNPAIGGVLLRGHKGTAKTLAARALAALLPPLPTTELDIEMRRNNELEYQFAARPAGVPFIELPLAVSDSRVVGQLATTSEEGPQRFELGLLALAHQGVLYVDEVNLLADPIINTLLDAAASGVNTVEREHMRASHLAKFVLIGSMNPQEGRLRPQMLDRFGLVVELRTPQEVAVRAEVVRRRVAFEQDPAAFRERFAAQDEALRARIVTARERLLQLVLADELLLSINALCVARKVEGLRADIVIYKTACALAAWEGRTRVSEADVEQAAALALPHRQQ